MPAVTSPLRAQRTGRSGPEHAVKGEESRSRRRSPSADSAGCDDRRFRVLDDVPLSDLAATLQIDCPPRGGAIGRLPRRLPPPAPFRLPPYPSDGEPRDLQHPDL